MHISIIVVISIFLTFASSCQFFNDPNKIQKLTEDSEKVIEDVIEDLITPNQPREVQ